MSREDRRELADAVSALRHDPRAVVPPHLEDRLTAVLEAVRATVALREDDDEFRVPPQLEARLVAAFREHHAAGMRRRDPGAVHGYAWYAGRAAVLLAAVAGAVWFGQANGPRVPRVPRAGTATVESAGASSGATPSGRRDDAGRRAAATRSARSRLAPPKVPAPLSARGLPVMAAASAPDVERGDDIEGGFMPLSYGDAAPGEERHVVAVEVPRAALLDFGAQADAAPEDATAVRAELLMSEDGMPRGIRFLDRVPAPLGGPSASTRTPLPSRRRLQP